MSSFLSDLEIANQANKKHINDIAKQIDVPEEALIVYGMIKQKLIIIF
jgi:formyltetrahydrofolate synthetase